ncbi:uncharacterized protein LOC100374272 [Saccoglossus kowalevskii]|uniref:Uncharacterized protein LOC100374272 n=1 Tax=Saccoglossus kowalevskii TaxID=10224 RepID=A0ABM0GQD7_SACKO|nr:PREDICTED: uncharacterized protein LOC100374272 [Saccoglossus kowalevskii]
MAHLILVLSLVWCLTEAQNLTSCVEPTKGTVSGEAVIGVLFPFHKPSADGQSCTSDVDPGAIQILEAVKFTLERRNSLNPISGLHVGFEAWDSCGLESVAMDRSLRYLNDKIKMIDAQGSVCPNSKLRIGMLADRESDTTRSVANILNDVSVPQISYGATATDFADETRYPYLFRTVPSDMEEAKAIVEVLKRLGWVYIDIIYTNDEAHIREVDAFKEVASDAGICVASHPEGEINIKVGTASSAGDVFNSILNDVKSDAIVAYVTVDHGVGLLKAAETKLQQGWEKQWLFSAEGMADPDSLVQEVSDVTRGIMGVIASTFTNEVNDFMTYFRSIKHNDHDEEADPWFSEFVEKTYGCQTGQAACDSTQQHDSDQNRFVSPVMNAVSVFYRIIKLLHDSKCQPNFSGICQNMFNAAPNEYLSLLQSFNLNADETDSGESITFNQHGDIKAAFDIANHDGTEFNLVGSWNDGHLSLDLNDVKMWVNNVQTSGENLPKSVCQSPVCMDPACGTPEDIKIYIAGDILLGGLFPIHEKGQTNHECGSINTDAVVLLEAMIYTLGLINDDDTHLQMVSIGMESLDSCLSENLASHAVLQFLSTADFGSSGSGTRLSVETGETEHIFGIVGGSDNDVCAAVSKVLQVYNIPEISYNAGKASLSNQYNYPNFLRTVPPNTFQVAAIIQTMVSIGWTKVQIIHSEDSFGWDGTSVLRQQGPRAGICVTQYLGVQDPSDENKMDELFTKFNTRPDAPGLVVLGGKELARSVLQTIKRNDLQGKYFLIGCDRWGTDPTVVNGLEDVAMGSITVTTVTRQAPGFVSYMLNRQPDDNAVNPWFEEFWMNKFQCKLSGYDAEYANECQGTESLSEADIPINTVVNVIDAITAYAYALDNIHQTNCYSDDKICHEMSEVNGKGISDEILSTRFDSLADGRKISFNYQGDIQMGFNIYNYQKVGNLFSYEKIGYYDNSILLNLTSDIKFYTKDGEEMETPPKSECIGPCDDCIPIETKKVAEVAGGEVLIGGLFEIREPGKTLLDCGDNIIMYNMQQVEAFLFAVDEINADNETLPNLKLGAIAFDTCGISERAVRETTNFVTGSVEYRSGYSSARPRVSAIIGGSTSDTSVHVATILSALMTNQISYGATTEELSDTDTYPFFMRTVPSDVSQVAALIDIISSVGWSYVSVVYTNNAYGQDMMKQFTDAIRHTNICIAATLMLDLYDTNYDFVTDSLDAQIQSKVAILFTSDLQTQKLLENAERKQLQRTHWIGTDTWGDRMFVVENATSTSQGAITLQFRKKTSRKFEEYFTSLNGYSNYRNPWWQEWWMNHFLCNLNVWNLDKIYDSICSVELDLSNDFEEEANVRYIVDAVWAFAKGLDATLNDLCPNQTHHLCPEVVENPEILHRNILEVQFKGHGDVDFSFDSNGNGPPSYDVFNLQRIGDTLKYIKIGGWENGNLDLDPTDILSYNDNDEPVALMNSECLGRCQECVKLKNEQYIELPGQIHIPALFSVHNQNNHLVECGDLRENGFVYTEAMLYAIDEINKDDKLLPGIQLGTVMFDTCMSGMRGVRDLSQLLSGLFYKDKKYSPSSFPLIAGVIGAETDVITTDVITMTNQYKYTLVSYGASSSLINILHPYFVSAVPSDDKQAAALFALLQQLHWTHVSVVVSRDGFSKAAMRAFTNVAPRRGICIATIVRLDLPADYQQASERLSLFGTRGVVILFTDPEDTRGMINAAFQASQSYQWVLTNGKIQNDTLTNLDNVAGGFIIISRKTAELSSFDNYFVTLNPDNNVRNPWFQEYWQETFQCNLPNNAKYLRNCSNTLTLPRPLQNGIGNFVGDVINSVYAIANGIHNLINEKCVGQSEGLCTEFVSATPEEFISAIQSVNFTLEGASFQFSEGSGPGSYKMESYQQTTDNGLQFINVGDWNNGALSFDQDKLQILTPPDVPWADCSKVDCPLCVMQMMESTTISVPTVSKTEPSDKMTTKPLITPKSSKLLTFSGENKTWRILVLCLTIVVFILAVITLIFVSCHIKHIVFQDSSSSLNILLLIGVILLVSLNIAFVLQNTPVICGIQRFGLGFLYAMCYAALFVKAVRVYRIGKRQMRISGPKAKFISPMSQTIFYCGVMLSELLLAVEWLLIDPPATYIDEKGQQMCGQPMEAMVMSLLYVYLLLLVTTVIAFKARNFHNVFHESLYILITSLGSILTMIVWAVAATVGPTEYQKPALCFGILLNSVLILILMYLPKIKLILSKHDFFENASVTSDAKTADKSREFQNPAYNVYGEECDVPEDAAPEMMKDSRPQLSSETTTAF